MSRALRLIGLVSPILLVASCRDSLDPTAHDAGRPVADVGSAANNDPVLFYSTYLGGGGFESGYSIAVDNSGNAYVTGLTGSTDFPTTIGAFQTTHAGGNYDVFVTKVNATGSALFYSTYIGGNSRDDSYDIALDATGNAYVTGLTYSTNFPTTAGAFQTTTPSYGAAFVTKVNPTGSALAYSTYLGGPFGGGPGTTGHGIAVDATGDAYVTGFTYSTNFPTTIGAFQTTAPGYHPAFVTKVNAAGSGLVYSTYLGGSSEDEGRGIALDATGNAYVTGNTASTNFPTTVGAFQSTHAPGTYDAFVAKVNPTGSALAYSTYLGGSGLDVGLGIAVDAIDNAYVTGSTGSANFPTVGAVQTTIAGDEDAFVTKLSPTGSALVYSTYVGGSSDDRGYGIAVDALANPNAYVTGYTRSTNFPTTVGAFQTTAAGSQDAFVTKLNTTGSAFVYSTYLGGSNEEGGLGIAVDALPNPSAYVTGYTVSSDFPATLGAFQAAFAGAGDAFVAKITDVVLPPPPTVGKVTGGGSIDFNDRIGTFGFIVQRQAADASIHGDLQYVNHESGAKVQSVMLNSFIIAGNTATFGGTCTNNGVSCTFTVHVTDNDEPGLTDTFTISVSGGPTEGGTLRSGNIQIHKTQ